MKSPQFTGVFTDQMGNRVSLPHPPHRIISLVPSQTELLFSLGLREEVAGITKFCVHPKEWHLTKPRVGGTKTLNMRRIAELKPDLIIGNKEENSENQIRELADRYPVWMSDIHNLADALSMITGVAALVGREQEAERLVSLIEHNFRTLPPQNNDHLNRTSVAYFIWRKPYMAAGSDTFIASMLSRCGFRNVLENTPGRYPSVAPAQLSRLNPEVIFLSSEPFPFSEKHFPELRLLCPRAKIMLVDGEYFSWYGSRLAQAPAYFNQVIGQVKRLLHG